MAGHFDQTCRGRESSLPPPTLWIQGYRMLSTPQGECMSAAGHMSDQRHSGQAQSHRCLLTAGWVMESRANRWAPDRAGIKGALSEKQHGGRERSSRENREGGGEKKAAAVLQGKMHHN